MTGTRSGREIQIRMSSSARKVYLAIIDRAKILTERVKVIFGKSRKFVGQFDPPPPLSVIRLKGWLTLKEGFKIIYIRKIFLPKVGAHYPNKGNKVERTFIHRGAGDF